jgi:hypothetical protein
LGSTAFHQVASDDHFAVAAIADQRDGVGFKEIIQVSDGHGQPTFSCATGAPERSGGVALELASPSSARTRVGVSRKCGLGLVIGIGWAGRMVGG